MNETENYIRQLKEFDALKEPIVRSAIQALKLPLGSQGLDVGCGIGLQSFLLADEVGPSGHVVGLDLSPEFILYGKKSVEKAGLSERISFREGDLNNLPFEKDTFDWIWSADCVGYPVTEKPVSLIKELSRVVKPGGRLAILAYSAQQLLPGYPLLEARLNATCSAYIPYLKGKKSQQNFLRALGWFREAGLEGLSVFTFVKEVYAPLSEDIKSALSSLFFMLWGERQPEVAEADWSEFLRLCRPDSQDCLLNQNDYYGFFTYSMFCGTIPQ